MTVAVPSFPVTTDAAMREVGRRLAGLVGAGDLVLLTGDLGAGKTTLTQGLGVALGVRGAVTSPTFVIARVHPSRGAGPALVHVDAYRLGGLREVEDLDLDTELADAVVVVEWGTGKVEELSEDRLELVLHRDEGEPDGGADGGAGADGTRVLTASGVGPRWAGVDLTVLDPRRSPESPESPELP